MKIYLREFAREWWDVVPWFLTWSWCDHWLLSPQSDHLGNRGFALRQRHQESGWNNEHPWKWTLGAIAFIVHHMTTIVHNSPLEHTLKIVAENLKQLLHIFMPPMSARTFYPSLWKRWKYMNKILCPPRFERICNYTHHNHYTIWPTLTRLTIVL